MLRTLNQFYDSQGIEPRRFACPYFGSCNADDSPKFTEAKASFVGTCYGQSSMPRLLFLSLDSGSSRKDPHCRTAEAVRGREMARDVEALPKHKHWYRTHEMAWTLLRQFKPDATIANVRSHFAHVNSAKCCQNKPGRNEADKTLFDNCRRFVPLELRVLEPDIVVTQGNWARVALCTSFDIRDRVVKNMPAPNYENKAHYETGIIELSPRTKRTLWLHSYHPNAYGHFNPQRKHSWPCYKDAVGRFWESP